MSTTIGSRIKSIRLKNGANQTVFATKLGTTQSYLSAVEKGKNEPTESIINLLSLNFGVNKEWLLTGAGEPYNEGYLNEVDPETPLNVRISDYELLELIIMNIESYLVEKKKVVTPAAKARFIMYFYKHFTKDNPNYDAKEIKKRIENSIDVLATVIGD
ncbi:hypothetical protein ADMFC3_23540 [Geovibrio sp. ADMFC3]